MFNISYRLNELGYKTFATRYKDWNRIYTGPFKDDKAASVALSRIKKSISKDAFIVHIDKREKKLVTTKQTKQVIKNRQNQTSTKHKTKTKNYKYTSKVKQDRREKIFMAINGGVSSFDVSEKTLSGTLPLDIKLEDSGFNYGLEAGYYFNNNMFMSINYQHSNLDDVSFDYVFASLNYQFYDTSSISPYIGALVGYNVMSWDKYPISSINVDDKASTFNMGLHLGFDVPLGDNFSLYTFYRYIKLDHKTELKTSAGEKEIEHSSEQNFNLGVKILF